MSDVRCAVSVCDAAAMGRTGVFAIEVWGLCGGWDAEVWFASLYHGGIELSVNAW